MRRIRILTAVLLILASACGSIAWGEPAPAGIRVVLDNNYPPFSFLDDSGNPQGITIDQWRLFEKKTGIPVTLDAMDWGKALEEMKAGRADVIDTIFYNEERAKIYDFTEPYAQIEVPVFFNRNISGITGVENLKGFTVAAKEGDNAVEVLKAAGITEISLYSSYEDIIRAARDQKVVTFVIDKPPALYFMYKMQIQDQFNYTESLYSGAFHRAVKKGDAALLETLEKGFGSISKSEYGQIDTKWYGSSPVSAKALKLSLALAGAGVAIFGFLMFWNYLLRSRVRAKTAELTRSVEDLQARDEQIKAILKAIPDMFFLMDRKGLFLNYHGGSSQDTYVPPEVFLGKQLQEVLPPDLSEAFLKAIVALNRTEQPQTVEYQLQYPQGKLYFEARLVPCGEERLVGIVRDITDRQKAEATIRRQIQDLETKNAEMERFTYTVSHDLKSPLITIKGFAGALLEDLERGRMDRVPRDVAKIDNAARKMQELLEDLLELSRVGRIVNPAVSFSMEKAARDVVELLHGRIAAQGVEVRVSPDLPKVQGDEQRIREVLQNLVENAVKFMKDTRNPLVEIGWVGTPEAPIFQVKDNGPGIDPAYHQKIFSLFDKLDPETEGTGIGLALVKRIIELHQGRIWVESEPGKGTRFCFTLNEKTEDAP